MINPWKKADSKEEAEQISGIRFPDILPLFLPGSMKDASYFCMRGLIEARYADSLGNRLILRKTNQETDRLSGDYNTYPAEYDCELKGTILRCKGTNDRINTAEFTAYTCFFSIVMNPGQPGRGLTADQLSALAEQFL